jgi:hypothetical protein
MPHNVSVTVRHDDLQGVFYIAASSIPGLEARASGLDELFKLVEERIPGLVGQASAAA